MNERLEDAVLEAMQQASQRAQGQVGGIPVMVSTSVPRELLAQYIQMLRSWDVSHGMDSAIAVLGGVPKDELMAMFAGIEPPFPFTEEWQV